MIYKDIIIGNTNSNMVLINKNELTARLGTNVDIESPIIKQLIDKFNESVTYRYAFIKVPFKYENGICYFENESIRSNTLTRVLQNSNEAFLLAVTAGITIDQLINRASIQNPVEMFYIDAIASAGIESYIDYVNNLICNGLNVTKRFSPGYADFPIEFQKYLLNRLSAKESIGIMLSDDCFMIPTKSITAVIGIK